ncbi:CAP domain-containing protein [Streptomyces sp. AC555_RSS877]|uniref:CAP domain-containing protein n=1 Tax=Streptomyces sp. AC555_RSS877 TaxID=2823688 RepID=UPI001C25D986|nr:CAP domain-containing protein [Streptomyces sp. AC555_RSS877]
MTRAALYAALALVAATMTPAWAGPPVPEPPPHYQAPLWPTPTPGHWQVASAGGPSAHSGHRPSAARPEPSRPGAATENQLVTAVNERREQAGCPTVRLHSALNRAARAHSLYMARQHRLTHVGAGGSSSRDRMRAAGYDADSAAETVTAGADDTQAAVDAWMGSPPHRAILLTCRYTHAGVGVAAGSGGPWWTLDLASGH